MKKIVLTLLLVLITIHNSFAKISFENPCINDKDEVVFTVNYDITGTHSYRSVFTAKLETGANAPKKGLITYYPEQMELLSLLGQNVIQIRNRYGIARYYTSTDSISWQKLVDEIPQTSTIAIPYAASPDGKWVCYVEKTRVASGRLVLESVSTGRKIELAENVLCSYDAVPAKWSPSSANLVYEKNGNIYFCSPDALQRGVEVDETHRKIGRGTINSVSWSSDKYLVYIDDYIVYRINSRELYTLGLYSGIIGQGTAIGRLPFQFNAAHDEFSVNDDLSGIVLAQEKRNFSYFQPFASSSDYMEIVYTKPYTDSKASLADYSIFWDDDGLPILWQLKLPYDSTNVQGTVIQLNEKTRTVLEIESSGKPILSPDKKMVAFFSGDAIYVYDTYKWVRLSQLSGEKVVNALWDSNNTIIVGGENTIKRWDVKKGTTEIIALSSAQSAFWDSTNSKIIAETQDGEFFSYIEKSGKWILDDYRGRKKYEPQNERFRAFCGTTPNPLFENTLYIRTLTKKSVTKPLFELSTQKMNDRQKVALIFDAYDNADGLPKIISSLKKFKVSGTFFINGEFIRRYPSQTKQITLNGYECASMFFTMADLTENSFVVDSDFIMRGLGRNEDEFYQCTGTELSLYWHAPYYNSNKTIIQAGNDAGYEYIKQSRLHSDNFSLRDLSEGKTYLNPEKLIEEYISLMKETKGGVIPITVGISQGGNIPNLWEHVDLLISALIDANFELVTMSEL